MLIECDLCAARGPACTDCVVSVLLGGPATRPGEAAELDGAERAAIAVLAGSGLIPPLRLLPLAVVTKAPEQAPDQSLGRNRAVS